MHTLWKKYSLAFVLTPLFLISWLLQTWFGWLEFSATCQQHGETARVFAHDGYIAAWGKTTFENWQSEFLQLLTFVILTSKFVYHGSPESRDGEDKMNATLARIEARVDSIASRL